MYESLASPEVGGENARVYAVAASPVTGGDDFAGFLFEGDEAACVCVSLCVRGFPNLGGEDACVYA